MIHLEQITKTYRMGDNVVHALRGLDLSIAQGEFIAIIGSSGSGKSTLMNILGCLCPPSSGVYRLRDRAVEHLSEDQLAEIRNREIGFVFQNFHLLARTTALDNVMLPLIYAGVPYGERERRARLALTRVGLGERIDHLPNQLSGGQRQRVAIARALVTEPTLILADEPTGNLDSKTTEEIMALFDELHEAGNTLILVTHEPEIAERTRRVIRIGDGQVVSDTRNPARQVTEVPA